MARTSKYWVIHATTGKTMGTFEDRSKAVKKAKAERKKGKHFVNVYKKTKDQKYLAKIFP